MARSKESVVSIEAGLQAGWLLNCGSIPSRAADFSLLHNMKIKFQAHPHILFNGYWGLFLQELKGQGMNLTTVLLTYI